jgi:hypothetical protein
MELVNDSKYLFNSYNGTNNTLELKELNHITNKKISKTKDLNSYFLCVYNQHNSGITSSCAIISIMSYYLNVKFNIIKLFSPYYLAYLQLENTKSLNSIDLLTGLNITMKHGLCSEYLINGNINSDIINSPILLQDANENKINNFSKISFTLENIKNLLYDNVPIMCSIKIIPTVQFYNHFNNYDYWLNTNNYYKNNDDIYAVSIVIVGYNNINKKIKIRGCWGENVGNNGCFYIDYTVITNFSNLFFDHFIINDTMPILTSSNSFIVSLSDTLNPINNNENDCDDDLNNINMNCIINTPTSNKSFKKVSSFSNIDDTIIQIESFDSFSLLYKKKSINHCNDLKNSI